MNKTAISAVVLAVVALGVALFGGKPSVVNQTLGSVVGPDSYYPCETHNGLTVCTDRQTFKTGTTTLVSFKSPTATSTLRVAAASISSGTTTPTQYAWGWSFQPDATTTSLGFYNLAASIKAVVNASTTPTNGAAIAPTADPAYVIPPNTFVNFKIGNALCTAGVTCSAVTGYAVVKFEY